MVLEIQLGVSEIMIFLQGHGHLLFSLSWLIGVGVGGRGGI